MAKSNLDQFSTSLMDMAEQVLDWEELAPVIGIEQYVADLEVIENKLDELVEKIALDHQQ